LSIGAPADAGPLGWVDSGFEPRRRTIDRTDRPNPAARSA